MIEKSINYFAGALMIYIICVLMMLSSCTNDNNNNNNNEDEDVIISVALTRFSTEIFLFQLDGKGKLEVFSGDRYEGDYLDSKNIDVVNEEAIILSEEEFESLNRIIGQIQ